MVSMFTLQFGKKMLSSALCQLQKETKYPRKSKRNFYLPEMDGFITYSVIGIFENCERLPG